MLGRVEELDSLAESFLELTRKLSAVIGGDNISEISALLRDRQTVIDSIGTLSTDSAPLSEQARSKLAKAQEINSGFETQIKELMIHYSQEGRKVAENRKGIEGYNSLYNTAGGDFFDKKQ